MSNEELVSLIRSGENVSENLENLYRQNLGLIMKSAKIFSSAEEIDDLCQEGYFGLVTAVECWDPEYGCTFSTYAYKCIWSRMKIYVDNFGSTIRLPSHQKDRIRRYKSAIRNFQFEFSKDPTPGELASFMGITEEELEKIKTDAQMLSLTSTDTPTEDGSETLGSFLQDDRNGYEPIENEIQNEQLGKVLWAIVDRLESKEKKVLEMRYKDGLTLEACGDVLGLSRERTRQIESEAINEMRRSHHLRKLSPFIEAKSQSIAYRTSGINYFKRTWTSAPERVVLFLESRNAL